MPSARAWTPLRLADRLTGFGPDERVEGLALPGERDLRVMGRSGLRLLVSQARPGMLLQV